MELKLECGWYYDARGLLKWVFSQKTMSFSSKAFPCLVRLWREHRTRSQHRYEGNLLSLHVVDHRTRVLREEQCIVFLVIRCERVAEAARW